MLIALGCLLVAVEARAEDGGQATPESNATEPASPAKASDKQIEIGPPPPGFDFKRPLSRDDYRRKKERHVVTGLPLFNFDSNTGFGGGVRAFYFWNGDRSDPLFGYTPYLHRVFAQAFASSGGLQFHWLDWDAPAIAGTPYRIRAQLIYMRNTAQHFHGIGSDAMAPLTFTGAGQSYAQWADYDAALQPLRNDGTTLSRYNDFDMQRPFLVLGLERTFLRGLVRPLLGVGFSYTTIDDYTGETVTARLPDGDVEAPMGPTLLREQCDAGAVIGCDGGFDNIIRLGVSFDTRDFEPDPNRGIYADLAFDWSTPALGSDYNYVRFLAAIRYFQTLLPKHTDLVFAGRATFQVQSGGVPFFTMPTIAWTEDQRTGLGGLRSLRGYRMDRFVGRVLTLLNTELRWTFLRFQTLKQKFSVGVVGFVDMGRVYDSVGDLTFRNWRRGQGAGLRIAWNLATILGADFGFSDEDTGLYINFHHQF